MKLRGHPEGPEDKPAALAGPSLFRLGKLEGHDQD